MKRRKSNSLDAEVVGEIIPSLERESLAKLSQRQHLSTSAFRELLRRAGKS